jgi:hypothetical protein
LKYSIAPEMRFRRFVANNMADHWMMCWHEDREISPGVPDLHYVMKGSYPGKSIVTPAVTGWLELKALDDPLSKSNRIKVEPSQKQWMQKWGKIVPIHFCVRIERTIFIVPSSKAPLLDEFYSIDSFEDNSIIQFFENDIQKELPRVLRVLTS